MPAAVGAHAAQFVRRTAGAEGALEGANHGSRIGRQVAVAAFAVGAQLQHGSLQVVQVGGGWLIMPFTNGLRGCADLRSQPTDAT